MKGLVQVANTSQGCPGEECAWLDQTVPQIEPILLQSPFGTGRRGAAVGVMDLSSSIYQGGSPGVPKFGDRGRDRVVHETIVRIQPCENLALAHGKALVQRVALSSVRLGDIPNTALFQHLNRSISGTSVYYDVFHRGVGLVSHTLKASQKTRSWIQARSHN